MNGNISNCLEKNRVLKEENNLLKNDLLRAREEIEALKKKIQDLEMNESAA